MENNPKTAQSPNVMQIAGSVRPQDDADEIDIIELLFTLLRNWKWMLLALVIGMGLMAAFHTLFVHPIYRASTELYITNTDSVISLQDLQVGSALTEDYRSIITSRAVLNQVIDDLKLNVNYKALKEMINVVNPTGTHIIRTTVTTTSADSSRYIANDLLNVSIDRIFQIVGTSEPTIIDHSEAEAVEDVTPSRFKYMAIGGLAGVLIVAVFVIIRVFMDNTTKDDDDVQKYLKLPVLAAVPYYEE